MNDSADGGGGREQVLDAMVRARVRGFEICGR